MNEVVVQQNQAISLIDSLDVAIIANTMQKISAFQAVVQKSLKQQHDYGIIQGTQKPTLLKPGAEKICMMLGVNPEYEFLERTSEHEKGFFNYEIKCTLMKNGFPMAQGVGCCNSYEKKYRWINSDTVPVGVDPSMCDQFTDKYGKTKYKIPNPNICDLANTILKMAKKRAFIDAVLQVASLSEIFTQDLEDMKDFMNQEQSAAAASMTPEEAGQVKCPFGKNKGKTLKDIYKEDKKYFEWLAENATDVVVKKACEIMVDAIYQNHPNGSEIAATTEETKEE